MTQRGSDQPTEPEEGLRFGTLLAEISARFVNVPAEQVDGEIAGAQRRMCEFLDLDRSSLGQVSEREPGAMPLTHIHQPQGSLPLPQPLDARVLVPWTVQKVLAGQTVIITKMSDLPPEAGRDRESYGLFGTKSVVVVPLSVGGGPPFGGLTFSVLREERDWPDSVVKGFQLIAQVFANALARKRSDEALRESEARLSLATNAAGAGLWAMEPETGHVWFTPKSRELFHFPPDEELNYESFFQVIHPEDREQVRLAVQQVFQSGEHLLSDYRIVLPDGSIRWIAARGQRYRKQTGEPYRLMGVSIDITERKRVEEALRASERQLRLMADSLPVLIAYIDREQRYRFNNLAYATWFGIPRDALRGVPVREVLGDKAYEAVRGYMEKALAGEELEFETKLSTRDGTTRYIQALYVPHVEDSGKVLGFYALVHDVTEHRRIDLEIQRQRDELAHVSRVAALGELTASLAHELHQPLAAIMSNAQAALRFLAQDEPDFQEIRDILQDIVADDRRANEVIQRLHLLLRRARPELAPLAINELIAEVLTLLKREVFLRGITIELHLDADLPPVVGDWVQLQQVVLNLVLNAADAMADGEPQSRRLIIRTERENEGKVRVAVRDFGTGLDGQNLHRLFEPFYSTKPEGLGMGLAICRSIVETHGGRLWAFNNPDRGATFMFTIRVSQGGEA
jgi:two-component system sensor kinase FixL